MYKIHSAESNLLSRSHFMDFNTIETEMVIMKDFNKKLC